MQATKFLVYIVFLLLFIFFAQDAPGKERSAEVVLRIDLKAPEQAERVRLWIPYPLSDKNQDITNIRIMGNYSQMSVLREAEFGTGKNIRLNPAQDGEVLRYFMYPYAEADGKPLNEDLYGFNLGYQIHFKES
jgi:hypothetical protein